MRRMHDLWMILHAGNTAFQILKGSYWSAQCGSSNSTPSRCFLYRVPVTHPYFMSWFQTGMDNTALSMRGI